MNSCQIPFEILLHINIVVLLESLLMGLGISHDLSSLRGLLACVSPWDVLSRNFLEHNMMVTLRFHVMTIQYIDYSVISLVA